MSHNNPSREIGTAWETLAVTYGQSQGFPLDRRALAGRRDLGDLMGMPGWVIGCKAEKTIRLSTYMDEIAKQKANHAFRSAGAVRLTGADMPDLIGVELVKRRGYGPGRAYAVMEFDDLLAVWRGLTEAAAA
jgi:hypothetical protein